METIRLGAQFSQLLISRGGLSDVNYCYDQNTSNKDGNNAMAMMMLCLRARLCFDKGFVFCVFVFCFFCFLFCVLTRELIESNVVF